MPFSLAKGGIFCYTLVMVIEINDLTKRFGDITAVDGLSFSVRKGELFAFLGVNGAGKSTTINVITGLLRPDGGTVSVFGRDITQGAADVKSRVGVVFQSSCLDKKLTVADNLYCRAALYGITGKALSERIAELDDLLTISDLLPRTVGKLSGGQRRRADLARALIHRPDLLILDEPTTGLDPMTRKNVWAAVDRERADRALTVLLTTHYMEEAAKSDYAIIIDGGKKVASGTPHALKAAHAKDVIRIYGDTGRAERELSALGYPVARRADYLETEVKGTAEAARLIAAHAELFDDFEVVKGDMDSVFLAVTGKRMTETDV